MTSTDRVAALRNYLANGATNIAAVVDQIQSFKQDPLISKIAPELDDALAEARKAIQIIGEADKHLATLAPSKEVTNGSKT